jgi:hypothetical protein
LSNDPDPKEAVYAQVGKLAMVTSAVDFQLTTLLSRLMAETQDHIGSRQASIFMFSARSIDQRFEILRKSFKLRCERMLMAPRHTNERRAADFAEKAMNITTANISKNRWVRNVAVHGSMHTDPEGVAIMPVMFDWDGWEAMRLRGPEYRRGLTLEHLQEATETARHDLQCLGKLSHVWWSLLDWKPDPAEFLERANALALDLKIQPPILRDPSAGPPMRKRRPKRDD